MTFLATNCSQCRRKVLGEAERCPLCGNEDAVVVQVPAVGSVETYTRVGDKTIIEVRLENGTLALGGFDGDVRVGMSVTLESVEEGRFVAS